MKWLKSMLSAARAILLAPFTTRTGAPLMSTIPAPTLNEHLSKYGIRHFSDLSDWDRWADQLGPKQRQRLNKLTKPLLKGATDLERRKFYSYVAESGASAVVHSMKADAIRATGMAVVQQLRGRSRILDVGCNTGYLTTWIGLTLPDSRVLGVDYVGPCLAEARRIAHEIGASNVEFQQCDIREGIPDGPFDAIVDCQGLSDVSGIERALRVLSGVLKDDGLLVSVSALRTAKLARTFMGNLKSVGLNVSHIESIFFEDLGVHAGYPLMLASRAPAPVEPDVEKLYTDAINHIADLQQHAATEFRWCP